MGILLRLSRRIHYRSREIKLVQDRNSKAILEIIADDNYRGVIIFDVRDEKVELSPGVLSFVPKISAAAWHGPHGQMKGSGHYYEEFLSQVAVIDSLPRILTLTFKEVDAASVDDQDPRAGAISDIGGVLRFGSWPETRNMEFYDLLGVRRYTAVINPDQIELSLPVDLMNGFYFVRLGSQSSKIAVVGR